jgi:ABC-type uncharacterized transport system substrate-binding protein
MSLVLKSKQIITFIVITLMFGSFVWLNVSRKTILILHSYNPEYAWIRDVNSGIKRVLKDQTLVRVHWHYMNTKNHPSKAYKVRAGAIARAVVNLAKPDVILAFDDDAQEYVAKYYVNEPGINIVFSGVNGRLETYGYDKANNVTGILERIPVDGIKEAVVILASELGLKPPIRVAHVSDRSEIVRLDDFNMHAYPHWLPLTLGKSFLVSDFDEWKKVILEAAQHMDIMLISNYRNIARTNEEIGKDGAIVPYKEVMQWAYENSPVPVIGVNGFVCEDGAAIALGTSPFEQGEVAMQFAMDVVKGRRKIKDIPPESSRQFIVFMDEERFKKKFSEKGLDLPHIYEAFARATDRFFLKEPYKY